MPRLSRVLGAHDNHLLFPDVRVTLQDSTTVIFHTRHLRNCRFCTIQQQNDQHEPCKEHSRALATSEPRQYNNHTCNL